MTQVVYGHWDMVTCLVRSECPVGGDCYIVSGSRDATLLVWHWSAKVQWVLGENHVAGKCFYLFIFSSRIHRRFNIVFIPFLSVYLFSSCVFCWVTLYNFLSFVSNDSVLYFYQICVMLYHCYSAVLL